MRTIAVFFLFSVVCFAASLQNVRFKLFGTHIPARPDLEVRWNVPVEDTLPSHIWVYRLLPRWLSPETTSYLLNLCSFTEKDRVKSSASGMSFKTPDSSRHLWISASSGSIGYDVQMTEGLTNLTKDVPNEEQALERVKQILPKLGISLGDIERKGKNDEPLFNSSDSKITYFVKSDPITNTRFRAVGFRRAVDGITFISVDTGGEGIFRFGDHGRIIKIDLSWRDLERVKAYRTLSVGEIIHSLLEGRAVQGYLSMDSRAIDWRTAKSVTVNHLLPRYYAGTSEHPSDMLEPFAVLDSIVDTGHGMVNVEIDCPIIAEAGE
jgi:hypothetical protein